MTDSPIRIGADPAEAADLFRPAEPSEAGSVSALEGLRTALAADPDSEPITLRVPARPGVTIRCHTRLTNDERKSWQNRARTKKSRGIGREPEVDELHFAMLVIANTCEAISFNGIDAHDEEGTPLTFRHAQLWDMLGAREPQAAIRQLFGKDAHVLLASGEVLLASGFDDDLSADGEGPTRG